MTPKSLFASLLALLFLLTSPADAALNAYLRLTGQKQGAINGSVTQKGRENQIMVIGVDMHSIAPFDAATGQTRGAPNNGAITITKELDKSSVALRRAMATNEVLSTFELRFWTPQIAAATGTGSEVQHFTVTLKNARIVGIHFRMLNNKVPENMKLTELEDVTFAYDQITYTWTDGGLTFTDGWTSAAGR